jgi:phage gp16-like protein
MSAPRTIVTENGRKADLAAIHMAKASLGLDDDAYRDLMATVCSGVRSAADLDFTGRKKFLAHLHACQKGHGQGSRPRPVRTPLTPTQRKMWALWMQLADAKLIEGRTMQGLVAFSRRQTGVERLEWLTPQQEALVLDSMKAWLKRGQAGAA